MARNSAPPRVAQCGGLSTGSVGRTFLTGVAMHDVVAGGGVVRPAIQPGQDASAPRAGIDRKHVVPAVLGRPLQLPLVWRPAEIDRPEPARDHALDQPKSEEGGRT